MTRELLWKSAIIGFLIIALIAFFIVRGQRLSYSQKVSKFVIITVGVYIILLVAAVGLFLILLSGFTDG